MASCATPVIHLLCLGVLHVWYMFITHVSAVHVLHLYFYTCNTHIDYAPVLHVWNMCITYVLYLYYTCIAHVEHI